MTQFGGVGRADLLACFALFDNRPENINQIEAISQGYPALIQKPQGISAENEPDRVIINPGKNRHCSGIGGLRNNEITNLKPDMNYLL